MEFNGEFNVASDPSETWDFLLNPDGLGSCIPNCQNVSVIDDTHYTATIGISISHISATFDTDVEIVDQDEEEYMYVRLSGDAEGGDSRMSAGGEVAMSPRDDGGTHLDYDVEMDVSGRMMNVGSRLVKRVADRQITKTINNLQSELGKP
jgi:carbon monoxide dehydrogenase subunit G